MSKHTVLGEVLKRIIGGGTPPRNIPEYYNGSIPWATVKDITAKRLWDTQEHVTEDAIHNSSANIVTKGSVVVATRMAVGRTFMPMTDMAINQDLKALIPDEDILNVEYLLYWIEGHQSKIQAMGTGTTVKGVRLEQIKSLSINVPPLPEQRRISEILSTVDDAITKTDQIIVQTETVKKGIMQRLLTKGIEHTRFKQTEIGEIPEIWEVVNIPEVCVSMTSGGTPRREHSEYYGGPHLWVKTGELNDGFLYETGEEITDLGLKNSSAKLFPKGTVLVAMYGATIGKTAILGKQASTNQASVLRLHFAASTLGYPTKIFVELLEKLHMCRLLVLLKAMNVSMIC